MTTTIFFANSVMKMNRYKKERELLQSGDCRIDSFKIPVFRTVGFKTMIKMHNKYKHADPFVFRPSGK